MQWGDLDVNNCLQFPYLGSIFQTDGDQMPDIRSKCERAKARAGTLRHIWAADLPLQLKLRLYISACCSILVWGSEGWLLNEEACRCINGTNAYMLSHITGKSKHVEATTSTTTFDILAWIRARRLRWVGHIMRMQLNSNGEPRQIKETLRVIFDNQQEGDILMDVSDTSWDELQASADNRGAWRAKVKLIKDAARATTKPRKTLPPAETTHQLQTQRFTFLPEKEQNQRQDKTQDPKSDEQQRREGRLL